MIEGKKTVRSVGRGVPTLADALEMTVSPREARRLALRLSQALAALHAGGTVHGALSPGAIELSRDGGVKILEGSDEEALTRLRYAAPEVARHETATAASDVFSLSLIVRELFEGVPARRGDAEQLAVEAVDGRVSAPHGLDPELTSLAALAASPHSETRPRAAEFVAALEERPRFQGLSRHDWLVIGLALLAAGLLVLLLRRSGENDDRSNRQFEDTRAAFDGFFEGLYPELDRVEDIEPLATAGKLALSSMEELHDEERDAADWTLLARALLWNGQAQRILGNEQEARGLFQRASEGARELDDRTVGIEVELRAETALGELEHAARDLNQAKVHLLRSRALGQERLESYPDDRETRLALARTLESLGDVTMSSGTESADRARTIFRIAREHLNHPSLVDLHGGLEVKSTLSNLDRMESAMAWIKGDVQGAAELLESHVERAKELAEMDPGRASRRRMLARGADSLARTQRTLGRLDDSVASYRLSVESWRLLRAMEPDEPRWRRQWAQSTRDLARVLAETGEWQEAAELHAVSFAELQEMLRQKLVPEDIFLEIGEQRMEAVTGLLYAGDLTRAREELEAAQRDFGEFTPSERQQARWQRAQAVGDVIKAELLLAEGRWRKAETTALDFIDRVQELALEGDDLELRTERARALLVSSAVRAMNGELEVATGARERAIAIADELIREDPTDYGALALRARALFVLGRDVEAAETLAQLDQIGYRGAELAAVRAATAALRR